MASDIAIGCAIVGLGAGVGLVYAIKFIIWLIRRPTRISAAELNDCKPGIFKTKGFDE